MIPHPPTLRALGLAGLLDVAAAVAAGGLVALALALAR